MTDRLTLMYAGMKTKHCWTNDKFWYKLFGFPLSFLWRTGCIEDVREGTFWYFIYWLVFCVCSSDHNHVWKSAQDRLMENKQNIPWQKYNFYRLFTFISWTVLNRSYFGEIFFYMYHGKRGWKSNLRSFGTYIRAIRKHSTWTRCLFDLKRLVEKGKYSIKNPRIDSSDIDEQEKSCKQSAVTFETPDRIGDRMHFRRVGRAIAPHHGPKRSAWK